MAAMPPLGVDAKARDITIDIHDSCNTCCWCCRHVSDETRVYINAKGQAVKFDPKSADEEREAMRVTIERLRLKLEEVAEASKRDTEEIKREFKEKFAEVFEEEAKSPVTVSMVTRINRAIEDLFA